MVTVTNLIATARDGRTDDTSFRTAMSLDDDQYEYLRALVERSKDDGFKMDFLQFRKEKHFVSSCVLLRMV